jgi:hypothetical protein
VREEKVEEAGSAYLAVEFGTQSEEGEVSGYTNCHRPWCFA